MPGSDSTHEINNSSTDIMDASTLSRWTRFALKGGIGQCTATTDYLAENASDLMFLAGDQITVLMQLDEHSGDDGQADWYLGYCEGVVGRFLGQHVRFHGKLKKPVMAKRQSSRNTTSSSPLPTTRHSPAPTLTAQSPPSTVSTFSPTQTPTLTTFLTQPSISLESEDSPILPISPSPRFANGPERTPSPLCPTKPPTPTPSPPPESDHEREADVDPRTSQLTTSSRYSYASRTSSILSQLPLPRGLQGDDDEQEDGDGKFGIGFALMQGDDSDEEDRRPDNFISTSTASPSPEPLPWPGPSTPEDPQSISAPSETAVSPTPSSPLEPVRFPPSSPRDSLKPSVHSASEWESDMDIYDDYRYSRYSVTSRVSRFSQMSTATKATGSGFQPPLPRRPSLESRPSNDSARPTALRQDSAGSSTEPQPFASLSSLNLRSTPPAPLDLSKKEKSPHSIGGQPQASPLLHTTWGSPESSPEPTSIKSPGSARFVFGFGDEDVGMASAMRRRLEGGIRTPDLVRKDRHSVYLGRGIVVEDEESPREGSASSSALQPPNIQVEADEEGPLSDAAHSSPPPSPLSTLPPPSPLSAPPSFVRPTLSDLRDTVDPVTRTSIFLPHPNAPRPNLSSESQGPKYVQPEMRIPNAPAPTEGSLIPVMIQAISTPPMDRFRGPTIYGRLKGELASSAGPVGMWFTIAPTFAAAPPPTATRQAFPPIAAPVPRRAATVIPPTMTGMEEPEPKPTGEPLPRKNPPQPAPRPRSRSFSGFDSESAMPIPKPRSNEEPAPAPESDEPTRSTPQQTPASATPTPPTARSSPRSKVPPPKANHAPSPLSLPQNNSVVSPPLAVQHLRHVSSSSVLEEMRASTSSPRKISNASTHTHFRHLSSALSRNSASSPTPASSIQESVETRSMGTASPSPSYVSITRNLSLRSKLSLPNLRRTGSGNSENQTTVHVDDMDFEMIRPNIPTIHSPRTSEDSKGSIMGRDSLSDSLLRNDSPSLSNVPRSPATTVSSSSPLQGSSWPLAPVSAEDMEAHRNRELRWMALISGTPASQARKSKKVKKLVIEGVPASVRSLVWGHLTDGKAKAVDNVYRRLAARGKENGKGQLVEDDLKGPLSNYAFITEIVENQTIEVLRAYLTMVPDVAYCPGISLAAATVLTVIPEEDAFWTFVSIIDTHLRPYFAPASIQLEVDAELFSRALEINDPPVFKRIYIDLHMTPKDVCAPWFESVFANTLPLEMLHRVWDFFLVDGVPFLFRVGLAIISCCRRQILELSANDQDAPNKVLKYLHRPSSSWLPPSVDGFMTLVATGKVKEDEIKKMREKMVGQLQARKARARVMSPSLTKR